jgi:restriction system protein
MKNKMWMVRAGEGGFLFQDFKDKGVVAIGWKDVGDLTNMKSPAELKNLFWEAYKDDKEAQKIVAAGQVVRFRFEFKPGDYVITYNPQERKYLVGEIAGDYEYKTGVTEFNNLRKVKWSKEIERDKLSTSTKNTLGAISMIFEVRNNARNEILNILSGKEQAEESPEEAEDVIKEDMKLKAHEFIKDKVSKLDWSDMQRLIAGILRGMGYKTRISPAGADRGRDIEASPDGLGLVDPRVIVQVKHRIGQMGREDIAGFTGGLRPGHKGIYVSTGGFSKDARYEAERANIPITLLDLDGLVKLIAQYYDSFDAETRALIPLAKIYWPE